MKRISNYHSHVALCGHAEGTVEDYIKEAIKNNYEEVGISDHAPIPVYFVGEQMHHDLWLSQMMTKETFEKDYLKQLDYCIKKYPNIKILKGLEVEFIPSKDFYYQYLLDNVDYLNLGVHYFFMNGEIVNTYGYLSEEEIEGYVQTIEEALKTNYFSCLVHPDLYMYRIDEFTSFHEAMARRIIEACIKNDVYLEINANGGNRYPREEFWKIVTEYKEAKIVINSDAHYISNFHGDNIKRAMRFSEDLGLNVYEKMEIKKNKFTTQYVGHRGASYAGVVNNTLSGFKEGIRRNCYALECDVRVSKDGVYFIHHDPTFTTYNNNFIKDELNAKGINEDDSLMNYNWDDIKDLNKYYVYEGQPYFDKIILFEDYIKLCKDNNTKCVIELKYTNGINTNDVSKIDGLIDIIKKHKMIDQVFILTSMRNCLLYIKEKQPLMNLVLLTGETTTNMESIDWCIEHNIHFDAYHKLVNKKMINKLREHNLSSNVWTVNEKSTGDKFIELKVDFITTDVLKY